MGSCVCFIVKMPSYQHRVSHKQDKIVSRRSCLGGSSYIWKYGVFTLKWSPHCVGWRIWKRKDLVNETANCSCFNILISLRIIGGKCLGNFAENKIPRCWLWKPIIWDCYNEYNAFIWTYSFNLWFLCPWYFPQMVREQQVIYFNS